jgi:methionine sulfoxide reductase catalytic subunit
MPEKHEGPLRSEVTPLPIILNRRKYLRLISAGSVGVWLGNLLMRFTPGNTSMLRGSPLPVSIKSPFSTNENQTPFNDVTHYNNFYEFGVAKTDPAEKAKNLQTSPWVVSVEGEVSKPKKFDLDTLLKIAPLEERIYRHRCVEGWSIVVPWIGYSLSVLINECQPKTKARFVSFESYYDPRQMPASRYAGISFPYVEGLRLDEALNPLTLLCFGMYGGTLPNQDGAPVRLVVPWKYGFKSIKSLVKIRLVQVLPETTWNMSNPREYGFYSNVNPEVDHPRWSQAKERRLGEFFRRPTLMFNGYADQVTQLYTGMDLKKNF